MLLLNVCTWHFIKSCPQQTGKSFCTNLNFQEVVKLVLAVIKQQMDVDNKVRKHIVSSENIGTSLLPKNVTQNTM